MNIYYQIKTNSKHIYETFECKKLKVIIFDDGTREILGRNSKTKRYINTALYNFDVAIENGCCLCLECLIKTYISNVFNNNMSRLNKFIAEIMLFLSGIKYE